MIADLSQSTQVIADRPNRKMIADQPQQWDDCWSILDYTDYRKLTSMGEMIADQHRTEDDSRYALWAKTGLQIDPQQKDDTRSIPKNTDRRWNSIWEMMTDRPRAQRWSQINPQNDAPPPPPHEKKKKNTPPKKKTPGSKKGPGNFCFPAF